MDRSERSRPAGITVIAVLALAMGAIDLLHGMRILGYVVFGAGQVATSTAWVGWAALFIGFVWIALGAAFLLLQPWAWLLGVIMVGISIVMAFLGNLDGWQFGDIFVAMVIPLVILAYLDSDRVKAALGSDG